MSGSLNISIVMEKNQARYDEIHKIWGMIKLSANPNPDKNIIIIYCAESLEIKNSLDKLNVIDVNPTLYDLISAIQKYSEINTHLIIITDLTDGRDFNINPLIESYHIFGIGNHSPVLLHQLSWKLRGYYYTVTENDNILEMIEQCIEKISSTNIKSLDINLTAYDGSRIITIATPFAISEINCAKEYQIDIGHLHKTKTIIFRLSLRGLIVPTNHNVLKVEIKHQNTKSNANHIFTQEIFIQRPEHHLCHSYLFPYFLNKSINRYFTIIKVLDTINKKSCKIALNHILANAIEENYDDVALVNDLQNCSDKISGDFHLGSVYAIISKYLLENY